MEIDNKNKEMLNIKQKSFNKFYSIFKKTKKLIPIFINIQNNYQKYLENFEEFKQNHKKKIDELEINNNNQKNIIDNLNNELNKTKNEIILLKNENDELKIKIKNEPIENNENNLNKNINSKLNLFFKLLKKSKRIISFLQEKLKTLEEENEKLKLKYNKTYEDKIIELNEKINNLNKEKNLIEIKNNYITKDMNTISNYLKDNEIHKEENNLILDKTSSINSLMDFEKNKNFSLLISLMRKSTKILNFLLNKIQD